MVTVIIKKIFSFLFGLLASCKRLVCKIGGRRRGSGDMLLPTTDGTSLEKVTMSIPQNETELKSWEIWGDGEPMSISVIPTNENTDNKSTTTGHYSATHLNRQDSGQANEQDLPDIDYFQDMAPVVRKAKKVLIKKKDHSSSNGNVSNRLTMGTHFSTQGSELDSWEDSPNAWDDTNEDLTSQAEETLKETRREERERRHQEQMRKKVEREKEKLNKKDTLSAVKLS